MRLPVALIAALLAGNGAAGTAYVTDELVLGVYAEQSTQGPRLATLHSGARVETLAVSGESTQVRLADGTTGWVKSTYLMQGEPATVRIKQLQDELDRSRATTPELAEAAERSEVERLRRELDQRSAATSPAGGAGPSDPALAAGGVLSTRQTSPPWFWAALLGALGGGFWLGYAALARRIKCKFGGIKVY